MMPTFRIALARDADPNDAHTRRAGDAGHNMMQLKVHLHQCLLHVPGRCCIDRRLHDIGYDLLS